MEPNESTGDKAPARQERTASETTASPRKDVGHRRGRPGDAPLVTDGGRVNDSDGGSDDDGPRIAAGVNTEGQIELTIVGNPSHSINLEYPDASKLHEALENALHVARGAPTHEVEPVTDGGRFVDPGAYYLFDDVDERIIAECADRDAALEAARERDPDRFVAIAGDAVLQLMRDGHTIEWATGDQDVREVTDGGTPAESYALSESPTALGGRLEGGR
jgi:hypothetical protein